MIQKLLGISPDEANINEVTSKLQDIAGFFQGMSDSDIKKTIREITMGKFIEDKLSHVWSFCELNYDLEEKIKLSEVLPSREAELLKEEISSISDEIDLYYN